MTSYVESVRTGFLMFVGVGALVLAPLLVLHYLRFGRVEPRRAFVLYALLAYGLVAAALIFLPFPERPFECVGVSTVPFQWVTDMHSNMVFNGRAGIGAVVTSQAFVQQAFNVALFVPLGVVMRKAYGKGLFLVLLTGLGISLAVEAVQYSGNFGYYPCPYRIADVDDLISNTAGAALGWMLAPVALVVPHVPGPADSMAYASAVSVPRRLCGLVADLLPVLVLAKLVAPGPLWTLLAVVLLRVVLPLATGGRSLGGFLLRYRIQPAGFRLPLREFLGVTGLLVWLIGVSPFLDVPWRTGIDSAVVLLVLTGTFVVPVFRRDQRGWHDQAAGTRVTVDPPRESVAVTP